ncbi:Secondary metabolism regulator LAE1 [Pseudocercospora fuligena]|uniref:Secondary metabolism regulator LAE1 n=1 Tax=Pseudocercospora fuligena TaxID=685502 RepID=A0A8H6RM56_9PEZI|nr:Secondary metabolism regulator LAE1 [Pseudocercospora fuligena]
MKQDRLDLFHGIFTLRIDGKLHLAPVKDPARILDIGTGTGIWAIEAADKYENAEVYANDLSPIQPKWVPPNLTFEVDDVESDWPPRPPFDLIHARYMAGSIADWPRLMQQAYDQTTIGKSSPLSFLPLAHPFSHSLTSLLGGWSEFQDLDLHNYSEDNSIPEGNKVLELYKNVIEGCEKVGRTACPGPHLKKWMEEAGFNNVTEHIFKLPLGPWPKDMTLRVS